MLRNTYRKWLKAIGRGSLQPRPTPTRRRPWRGLRIEEMESRYAPAVTWSIVGGVLTATSDNLGNIVSLDHVGSTTIANGLNFADSTFSSIRINGGLGHDTDNLLATPAKPTVVNNAQDATVSVGKSGSVQGIQGLLSIENPPRENTITVDDSADAAARTVTLDTFTPSGDTLFGRITGLTASGAVIEYECEDTFLVTIKTGTAVDTVNVLGTGNNTTLVGNARETVNVGNGGSVQGITRTLAVTNPPSFSALTVDNSADATRHVVTMGASGGQGSIAGLAPAEIVYNLADVSSLTVNGGPNNGVGGGNVYTVTNTVNNGTNPLTTLNVGSAFVATVNVQATSGPLNVNTTGSSQTLTLGNFGSMQLIHGAVSLHSTLNNSVLLDDSADSVARTVTVNDTSIDGLAPAVITYQGLGTDIRAGSGSNTFTVTGNSGSDSAGTSLQLGAGFSQVNVRATTNQLNITAGSGAVDTRVGFGGTVANIHGRVFTSQGGSSSSLIVDDSLDTAARTATVGGPSNGAIAGLAPAEIDFVPGTTGLVAIEGGGGTDTYNVTATPPGFFEIDAGHGTNTVNLQRSGGRVALNGGGGPATFNLGNTSDGTASIAGEVDLGGNGAPAVNINDAANPFSSNVTLHFTGSLEDVTGLGDPFSPFTLTYGLHGISGLTINGGSHGNTYNVQQDIGIPVILHTGSGNDTVNVGDAFNTLNGIQTLLSVDGQGGFDTLNINDQGETVPHTYTVLSSSVTRSPGGPVIFYTNIESLNLHPGALLANGPTNNVVNVESTDANTSVEVDAVAGAAVNVGNEAGTLDDLQGPLNVYGDGTVSLNVNDQGSADAQDYSLAAATVDRTGAAETTYAGVADVTLNAGAGGNQIDVQSLAAGTPATVNAGPGGDLIRMRGGPVDAPLTLVGQGNTRLGYVAYTTPVFVDVQTGQATDVAGGFSGISDITGGSDVNILVGDGTVNLTGAPGSRNLLISGGGSGLTLTGGGAGDILIDGTTAYDADANGELDAIMAEWTRTDIGYSDIVANILTGSDTAVDPYALNESTVFDNGGQNNLVGHPQGGEMNLYFVANNDTYDATPDETVVNISGSTAGGGGRATHPGNQAIATHAVGVATPSLTPVQALDAAHVVASTRAAQSSQTSTALAPSGDQDLAWLGGANALALEGLGVG